MKKKKIEEWFFLLVGVALMALGLQSFLEPARLVAGGITGIGIIMDAITTLRFGVKTPLWLVNIVLNLPLFYFAWKKEGGRFLGKTILTALLLSGGLFLVENFLNIDHGDDLLAAVYGGALVGIGTGLVLRAGATTGGVDLAASLINRYHPRLSIAKGIFLIDAIIIFAGLALFGSIKALYAILSVFVTERCTAWVLEGLTVSKAVFVVSDKAEGIKQAIICKLERGVTTIQGKGGYTGDKKEILFCIFSQKEVHKMKELIMDIDGNAFFFMADIRETFGEGFGKK